MTITLPIQRVKKYRQRLIMGLLTMCSVELVAQELALPAVPKNSPNVVFVLLDDVGFGATSTFGGPVHTATLNTLAQEGLRFNRFHTTAICSPTRASLLTGRDSHAANVGAVLNSSSQLAGYQGVIKPDTATIAQILKDTGYRTAAFGKWHLAPPWETTPIGPFNRWPVGLGFETFYGFLGGETDQFDPTLYRGTAPVQRPHDSNYHVTEDLVNKAIEWLRTGHSLRNEQPFFMYFATGAAHAPLQVPKQWIDNYQGQFDGGWDTMREHILQRQIALGVVPKDTPLTPRPQALPAWDSLSPKQQQVAARLMETFAGFLAHTDHEIGRLVQTLKDLNEFDNTIFVYIAGDNGSSAEGGLAGSINYMGALQGLSETLDEQIAALDRIGDKTTYPQYPAGWAWALTSPFQWVKQVASHLGGTRVGAVITWPNTIKDAGGLRTQFTHVNDIVPTVLHAAGIAEPKVVAGVAQKPMDGASLMPALTNAAAPEHNTTQMFEVNGNRAIYHNGWMASAFHKRYPWSVGVRAGATPMEDDTWELYNLNEDYSQSNNLAPAYPEKLAELQAVFQQEAERLAIWPIQSAMDAMNTHPIPNLHQSRTEFTYYPGAVGIAETQAPPIYNRSWSISAQISGQAPTGVIATMGGLVSGWSLYLDEQSRPAFKFRNFEKGQVLLQSSKAVSGASTVGLTFNYDGGGWARGGEFVLTINDEIAARDRIRLTPPAYFSIDETFDIGIDTGSPAGDYPESADHGYQFTGGHIQQVDINLL
ncbi:MAG: sulfatase-like hydrolase/transferase [Halieaceae bacterium]|nr:sulfatase-like hydrolase/transferase [Halieaceae bacterium]